MKKLVTRWTTLQIKLFFTFSVVIVLLLKKKIELGRDRKPLLTSSILTKFRLALGSLKKTYNLRAFSISNKTPRKKVCLVLI